jgi:hypothetical protein
MISSLSESSVEARNCNLIYADTRDEVLSMAHWNFAKKTAYLSVLKQAPGTPGGVASATQWTTDYPAPPWLYEYAMPIDCIGMRSITQQPVNAYVGTPFTSNGMASYPYFIGPGAMFEVATDEVSSQQQNVILTNQYQAIGIYTMRVTNVGLFGAMFIEALVQALAAKLALALSGNVALAGAKFGQANAMIIQARANDANEGLTIIDNVPDWLAIRDDFGYAGGADFGYIAPYGPLLGSYEHKRNPDLLSRAVSFHRHCTRASTSRSTILVRRGCSTSSWTIEAARRTDQVSNSSARCLMASTNVRLIPFPVQHDPELHLEFGDFYMRVIKDGAQVLETAKTMSRLHERESWSIYMLPRTAIANGDQALFPRRWHDSDQTTRNTSLQR